LLHATALGLTLNRDWPDDSRTGLIIGAFPGFLQDRREEWTAISHLLDHHQFKLRMTAYSAMFELRGMESLGALQCR
jgi:hypothetical protein